MSRFTPTLLVAALLLTTGCTLGPNYQAPEVAVPVAYKHVAGWKIAQTGRVEAGSWWQAYGDARLNELVEQLAHNQDVAAAEARYRQAQSLLRSSRAGLLPSVGASADVSRGQTGRESVDTAYGLGLSAAWELDLWGKLRRNLEASQAELSASAADLTAMELSLQSTLVQSYLELRVLDQEQRLLEQTVKAYTRAYQLTQNQFNAGIVPKSDVSQALTQLKSAESQALELIWQRAQLEHAIAVLVGQTPDQLSITPVNALPGLPEIAQSVPSTLLERRPDIAASERRVAAANARIGVAEAAWFPDLTLSASGGYRGASFTDWISAPNRFWSLGPQFAMSLFDGGARRAALESAQAQYDQTVASYRQTVLVGFREVEDYLIKAQVLTTQRQVQLEALAAARQSLELLNNQYLAGLIDYNAVVGVQTAALNQERTALNLLSQQLVTSAQLITALGGKVPPSP